MKRRDMMATTLIIPRWHGERLRELARRDGVPINHLAAQAVGEWLERHHPLGTSEPSEAAVGQNVRYYGQQIGGARVTSQLVQNVQNRLPQGGEFQGRNGDCTEYAFMVGDAALDPAEPCDANELNRLTTLSINGGNASGSGAMTAANLAWLCAQDGHAYLQGTNWASLLAQHIPAGHPVILQVANGSQLPGNEGGVNGHAVVALDYDAAAQTIVIANGDSVNGRAGKLDTISMQDVQNAQPFAATVLLPNSGSGTGGGMVTDSGLGDGFKNYAVAHNITAPQVLGGEHYNQPNPGESWCAWDAAPILTYTPAEGVRDNQGGRIVKYLLEQLAAAQHAPAPAPAPVDQPTTIELSVNGKSVYSSSV